MPRRLLFLLMSGIVGLGFLACVRRQASIRPALDGKQAYKPRDPAALAPHINRTYSAPPGDRADDTTDTPEPLGIRQARAQAEASPDDPEAAQRLVLALFDNGRRLESLDQAAEARSRFPAHPGIALTSARLWHLLKHNAGAAERVREAIELDPQSVAAWQLAGDVELERGNLETAGKAYLEAIRLGGLGTDDLRRAGSLFLQLEWWSEAGDALFAVFSRGDRSSGTTDGLALARLRLGQEEAAFQTLLEAYRPSESWTRLGKLWIDNHDWAKAHEALLQALQLEPWHSRARQLLQRADSYLPPPSIITIPSFSDGLQVEVLQSTLRLELEGVRRSGVESPGIDLPGRRDLGLAPRFAALTRIFHGPSPAEPGSSALSALPALPAGLSPAEKMTIEATAMASLANSPAGRQVRPTTLVTLPDFAAAPSADVSTDEGRLGVWPPVGNAPQAVVVLSRLHGRLHPRRLQSSDEAQGPPPAALQAAAGRSTADPDRSMNPGIQVAGIGIATAILLRLLFGAAQQAGAASVIRLRVHSSRTTTRTHMLRKGAGFQSRPGLIRRRAFGQ